MYFLSPYLLFDVSWALLGLGSISVMHGWKKMRRGWMMTNLATSKVRSVAMGLAELKGKAKCAGEGMVSPVRAIKSVWDRVEVIKQTTDSEGNRQEKRLFQRERRVPFYLEDDTGRIMIMPDKAEISGVKTCDVMVVPGSEPPPDIRHFCDFHGVPWRFGAAQTVYRVQEWCVIADADLYVLGGVGKATNPLQERKERILKKLRHWKSDPEKLKTIDENQDGVIQQDEWMNARAKAQDEVMHEDLMKGGAAVPLVVRKPVMGFFLITSGTEADAIKMHGHPGYYVTGGVALLLVGSLLLPDTAGAFSYPLWRGFAIAFGIVILWLLPVRFKLGR